MINIRKKLKKMWCERWEWWFLISFDVYKIFEIKYSSKMRYKINKGLRSIVEVDPSILRDLNHLCLVSLRLSIIID